MFGERIVVWSHKQYIHREVWRWEHSEMGAATYKILAENLLSLAKKPNFGSGFPKKSDSVCMAWPISDLESYWKQDFETTSPS